LASTSGPWRRPANRLCPAAKTADWQSSIERYGTEDQPVVIIDNFAPHPEALREDAAMLAYAPMGIHYPGIRAMVA